MASEKITSILDAVKELSILELSELVSAIEEEFGVSAAMVVAGGGGGAAAEEDGGEEQTEFTVMLNGPGSQKIQVIKAVRELTGLGLKDAKALVDEAPKPIKEDVSKEDAEAALERLKEAGADAEIK
ncbi:MAG: 50S ribosomal protein L7/L12 [Fastidiosipilaceae bacterium]|nr:50S ribosomal protein L7/L12 [Clostridiaceae bacterium]